MTSDGIKPIPGDLIEISRFLHKHWAIYVGDNYVVHLASPSEVASVGIIGLMSAEGDTVLVKKELLYMVTKGDKYRVNNKNDDKYEPLPPNEIVQQAEEFVWKEVPYSAISNNSEHFVNMLRYGVHHSNQDGIKPIPGDLIEISRFLHKHWAVYVGKGYVVHLASPSELAGRAVSKIQSLTADRVLVKKELLYIVSRGDKYRVNNKNDNKYKPLPPNEIVEQAEEFVWKEVPYSAISNNSEHFVTMLRYGVHHNNQNGQKPKPGDLIEFFHGTYEHWAVYVGKGYVVHLSPPMHGKSIVKKELLYMVSDEYKYRVNNKNDDDYKPLPPNEIVQQAEDMVGNEVPYSLLSNNCEHFANMMRYGVPRSNQVRNGITTGAATVLFGAPGFLYRVGARIHRNSQ